MPDLLQDCSPMAERGPKGLPVRAKAAQSFAVAGVALLRSRQARGGGETESPSR